MLYALHALYVNPMNVLIYLMCLKIGWPTGGLDLVLQACYIRSKYL